MRGTYIINYSWSLDNQKDNIVYISYLSIDNKEMHIPIDTESLVPELSEKLKDKAEVEFEIIDKTIRVDKDGLRVIFQNLKSEDTKEIKKKYAKIKRVYE